MEPMERNNFDQAAKTYYQRQMRIAMYDSFVGPVVETLGIAIVLITHNLAVVEHVCDRAIVLYLGQIAEEGPIEELLAAEEARADKHIHLPSPSYWPIILALGLPVMGYGIIFERLLIAVGALMVLLSMFAWSLEPSVADDDDFDPPAADGGPSKELATVG